MSREVCLAFCGARPLYRDAVLSIMARIVERSGKYRGVNLVHCAAWCTRRGIVLVAHEAGLDCCRRLGDVARWWGNVVKGSTALLCLDTF